MSEFEIAKFDFRIEAVETLRLPPYKGSTFRGAFGHAFRRVCCSERRKTCDDCPLRRRCVYSYVFETPLPDNAEMMRLYPKIPHPFVIEPPLVEQREFPAGSSLSFGLVLVGGAIQYLPYFVYAFREMGNGGIGRGRGRYELVEVTASAPSGRKTTVYSSVSSQTVAGEYPAFTDFGSPSPIPEEVTLEFVTPLRVKFGGRLARSLPFDVLVRNLLRRISALSYFHCGRRLDVDFKGLIEKARAVKLAGSNLHWRDWERYSSRQDVRMSLGGLLGEVAYSGDLAPFWRYLCIGEYVHLGKATAFGLGKYEIVGGQVGRCR